MNSEIPPAADHQAILSGVVEKLRGDVENLPGGVLAFAHDVFAILRGTRPADAVDAAHQGLLGTLPVGRIAKMLECILSAWVSPPPATFAVAPTHTAAEPALQPLAGVSQRFLDGGYAR